MRQNASVHVGDVMYGNIGSRTRLNFTVIGPAVNMASRLESLTKQLGGTVPLSRAFADFVESDFELQRVGEYPVRGFNDPSSCSRITAECRSMAERRVTRRGADPADRRERWSPVDSCSTKRQSVVSLLASNAAAGFI